MVADARIQSQPAALRRAASSRNASATPPNGERAPEPLHGDLSAPTSRWPISQPKPSSGQSKELARFTAKGAAHSRAFGQRVSRLFTTEGLRTAGKLLGIGRIRHS